MTQKPKVPYLDVTQCGHFKSDKCVNPASCGYQKRRLSKIGLKSAPPRWITTCTHPKTEDIRKNKI